MQMSEQSITNEQALDEIYRSILVQIWECKHDIQQIESLKDNRKFFDDMELGLRVAVREIRAGQPGRHIQEIMWTEDSHIKRGEEEVPIARRDSARLIQVISGGGILGIVHQIRSLELMVRARLLSILRQLAVLRGAFSISAIGTSDYIEVRLENVVDDAKADLTASVNRFLDDVGTLRAVNHQKVTPGSFDISRNLSQDFESLLAVSGHWVSTRNWPVGGDIASQALGKLLSPRTANLDTYIVPDARNTPPRYQGRVNSQTIYSEVVNKDAAIAIGHDKSAQNPWRHVLFDDMSSLEAAQTEGRILGRLLEDQPAILAALQIRDEPVMPRLRQEARNTYLVIGTLSVVVGSAHVSMTNTATSETTTRIEENTIIRTITVTEANVTTEIFPKSTESEYCFALRLRKVAIDFSKPSGGFLSMELLGDDTKNLVMFGHSPPHPRELEQAASGVQAAPA